MRGSRKRSEEDQGKPGIEMSWKKSERECDEV